MRSPLDPIRRLRLQLIALSAAAGGAILACATWALMSLEMNVDVSDVSITVPERPRPQSDARRQLDLEAFQTVLWIPREQVAASNAEPERVGPRPRPPSYALLGIITNDQMPRAALYDTAQRKLHVVSAGEALGIYTVSSISPFAVILTEEEFQHELRLKVQRASFVKDSPS